VRYSTQPWAQCKGQSAPGTENSVPASHLRRMRRVPLPPEERASLVAALRAALAAPAFQARHRAGERGEQP
jgi:hypothetical protein